MRRIAVAIMILFSLVTSAGVKVTSMKSSGTDFALCAGGRATDIYVDTSDYEAVRTVASLFADDIRKVTGIPADVIPVGKNIPRKSVVAGTVGHNSYIDGLIASGRLDVSPIEGGWEQFVIKVVDGRLVIAGCDRRGTAYGMLEISEAIGVSPLYWWADVPVKRKSSVYLSTIDYVSKRPSVKYRGIFINDEGWGITPWAAGTYDPELGDIGPKTYAAVCELILRMKGNMLAPAMHPGSGAFNKYPENKEVADRYAIVMSSSHCEPLLFNNVTEWKHETMGDWNYVTNKNGINRVLEQRISENGRYENVYTLAMRGIHDSGLVGVREEDKVKLMAEVLGDQRRILERQIGYPADSIPQIFVPYKEVLDIYERGLEVPEDVTLVWPDDNFGYLKRLSSKEEQKRSGRSGVYYHISYCGEPHDYLWLNTTPNTLMYEELSKAYRAGADRYWLLNVGDIKPGELGMKYFMDLAWDVEAFDFDSSWSYVPEQLAYIFGEELKDDLTDIMDAYFLLGFQHKPEAMGWGFEWNNHFDRERVIDTGFSFVNYEEAEKRMAEYDRIAVKSEMVMATLPDECRAAYYELVHYPVIGAALMNRKMLTAQRNRWYARKGRSSTNHYADLVKEYHDSLEACTARYNMMLDGKWNGMMSVTPGWTATYQEMPPVSRIDVTGPAEMNVFIPGQSELLSVKVLPVLDGFFRNDTFIELYNTGSGGFDWKAEASEKWIVLSMTSGTTFMQDRINVSVDWDSVPCGENISGEIVLTSKDKVTVVHLPVFNPVRNEDFRGKYIERDGYVSICAGDFTSKSENRDISVRRVNGLGYENACVQLGETGRPVQNLWRTDTAPCAEYDFYTFSAGDVTVHVYALPLFPVDRTHDTRYGVMIDDGMVQWMTTSAKEYSSRWRLNVFRNSAVETFSANISSSGWHKLRLICADPGMVIQKIVIDFGGMKRSYLGPEITKVSD